MQATRKSQRHKAINATTISETSGKENRRVSKEPQQAPFAKSTRAINKNKNNPSPPTLTLTMTTPTPNTSTITATTTLTLTPTATIKRPTRLPTPPPRVPLLHRRRGRPRLNFGQTSEERENDEDVKKEQAPEESEVPKALELPLVEPKETPEPSNELEKPKDLEVSNEPESDPTLATAMMPWTEPIRRGRGRPRKHPRPEGWITPLPSSSKTSSKKKKMPNRAFVPPPPRFVQEDLCEYELLRLEKIRINQEMLMSLQLGGDGGGALGLFSVPTAALTSSSIDKTVNPPAPKRKLQTGPPTPPARVSKRLKGMVADRLLIGEKDRLEGWMKRLSVADEDETKRDTKRVKEKKLKVIKKLAAEPPEPRSSLLSADAYFSKEIRDKAIRVDGQYKGWLEQGVIDRHGFNQHAPTAKDIAASPTQRDLLRSVGIKLDKRDAKDTAKFLFDQDPNLYANTYFYRHNEPGVEQWTGDWTEEEKEEFLQVARQYGSGTHWGLFSSNIRHRFGYQCSNFYRHVILPAGLIFDPNYRYTKRGQPIFCGPGKSIDRELERNQGSKQGGKK